MMIKKITLLTSADLLPKISGSDIGILMEYPPDSDFGKRYAAHAIPLTQLIGDTTIKRELACRLSTKLLADEPLIRTIAQFSIFQEPLSIELWRYFHILHLHDFLLKEGYTDCIFTHTSWWGIELKKLTEQLSSTLCVIIPPVKSPSPIIKVMKRLTQTKFSRTELFEEYSRILNHIDPFHRRAIWLNRQHSPQFKLNMPWFYSTAINYTNIGLAYQDYFSESLHFLIENPATGGKPLTLKQKSFINLYHFAATTFIPEKNEIKKSTKDIFHHLKRILLHGDEIIVRDMLLSSSFLHLFFTKFLPTGLFNSSLFKAWINQTQPSMVVVGNQVNEGYALNIAQQHHIPTILLQHGVFTDCFQHIDYPIDHYIIRGQFFHHRLSPASQKRAHILNPRSMEKIIAPPTKTTIVFITMPLQFLAIGIGVELDSLLTTIVHTAAQTSTKLVIRVHPLEKIVTYQHKIKKILKHCEKKVTVHYSQGDHLNEVLANALAVIAFGSTVFLDCIKQKVPIISFDWHHFGFKENIRPYAVFNFARDLTELQQFIFKAVKGELTHQTIDENFFLADSHAEEIKRALQRMISPKMMETV